MKRDPNARHLFEFEPLQIGDGADAYQKKLEDLKKWPKSELRKTFAKYAQTWIVPLAYNNGKKKTDWGVENPQGTLNIQLFFDAGLNPNIETTFGKQSNSLFSWALHCSNFQFLALLLNYDCRMENKQNRSYFFALFMDYREQEDRGGSDYNYALKIIFKTTQLNDTAINNIQKNFLLLCQTQEKEIHELIIHKKPEVDSFLNFYHLQKNLPQDALSLNVKKSRI